MKVGKKASRKGCAVHNWSSALSRMCLRCITFLELETSYRGCSISSKWVEGSMFHVVALRRRSLRSYDGPLKVDFGEITTR